METYSIISDFPGHPHSLRHVLAPLFTLSSASRAAPAAQSISATSAAASAASESAPTASADGAAAATAAAAATTTQAPSADGGHGGADSHKDHGDPAGFKWLLLGDDDTIFVVPAVLALLNRLGLSPEEPVALTDFLFTCPPCDQPRFTGKCPPCMAPVQVDPRCEPCPVGPPVCPCRLPPGCTLPHWTSSRRRCRVQDEITLYGGAGVILSVGMVRLLANNSKINYMSYALANLIDTRPFGDIFMSDAIRRVGYGFTSTGIQTHAAPPPPPPPPSPILRAGGRIKPDKGLRVWGPVPGLNGVPPPPNLFATFCRHADQRTMRQMTEDFRVIKAQDPETFSRMVSVHARTAVTAASRLAELDVSYLQSYRTMVEELLESRTDLEDLYW